MIRILQCQVHLHTRNKFIMVYFVSEQSTKYFQQYFQGYFIYVINLALIICMSHSLLLIVAHTASGQFHKKGRGMSQSYESPSNLFSSLTTLMQGCPPVLSSKIKGKVMLLVILSVCFLLASSPRKLDHTIYLFPGILGQSEALCLFLYIWLLYISFLLTFKIHQDKAFAIKQEINCHPFFLAVCSFFFSKRIFSS